MSKWTWPIFTSSKYTHPFPLPQALKKLKLAAGRCRYQMTEVQKQEFSLNYVGNEKEQARFLT
jgi:hypothetical protein